MDEATLEATIAAYRQQLQQVEAICQSASGEEATNLLQLQKDLRDVIELTQGSLLSLKKSKLLSYVDDITSKPAAAKNSHTCEGRENEDPPVSSTMDEEFAAFQAAIADEGGSSPSSPFQAEGIPSTVHHRGKNDYKRKDEKTQDNDSNDDDDDDEEEEEEEEDEGENDRQLSDITGTKCSIVYRHEWGAQQRHNAIVLSVEPCCAKDDEVRVRVLFCNPTNAAMKPCPFFFKGECRFAEEDCRFSHGFSVKVTELKPFQEVDLSCLSIEAKCLAKYTDGIWYPAEVTDIDPEAERITVCFESYGDSLTLGVGDVLPLGSQDSQSDDDGDDEDADEIDSDGSDHDRPSTSSSLSSLSRLGAQQDGDEEEEEEMADVLWVPTGPSCRLGEWEVHTRGIASKLMAKMGYEIGKGLGKNSEGRTEPVEAVIVPAGKSLDTCMKLREMKKLGIVGKKKAKRRGKGKKKKKKNDVGGAGSTVRKPRDVFEFINTHLGAKKVKVNELLADNATLVKSQRRPQEESKGERIAKSRQINVQLLKTQEEVRATEKRLSHLKQSLARNRGDKAACATIQAKIAKAEQYLITVRSSEKKLERQKDHREGHKKLTIF